MKTVTSIALITLYILNCLRYRTAPWKYFQLNASYFSRDKGIFSKLQIDELVPEQWRLAQHRLTDTPLSADSHNRHADNTTPGTDTANPKPAVLVTGEIRVRLPDLPHHTTPPRQDLADCSGMKFPIFVKPEWGQNAQGIVRADNCAELSRIRRQLNGSAVRYIAQEAATERHEYEIYTVFPDADRKHCAVISVTESINQSQRYPINSIYNQDTLYHDITSQFSQAQLHSLSSSVQQIGSFAQSRLCVRADSMAKLCAGDFHVIELNLFTPMPINLLDKNMRWPARLRQCQLCASELARATSTIGRLSSRAAIYTRMTLYGRSTASATLRSLL